MAVPHATHLCSRLHHVGAKWVLGALEIGDEPVGVEYVKRRTVPGEEAADTSTKWKKRIPVLVFG